MIEEPVFCPRCGGTIVARVVKEGEPPRAWCARCRVVHYTGPKLAAGVICTVDGRLLLVRRSIQPARGRWVYPGGFVDLGESPAQAAAREAREEAGVTVRIDRLVGVYHNLERRVVVVAYAGPVVAGAPVAGDETLEAALFRESEIPWDAIAFETTAAALRDFLRETPPGTRP